MYIKIVVEIEEADRERVYEIQERLTEQVWSAMQLTEFNRVSKVSSCINDIHSGMFMSWKDGDKNEGSKAGS